MLIGAVFWNQLQMILSLVCCLLPMAELTTWLPTLLEKIRKEKKQTPAPVWRRGYGATPRGLDQGSQLKPSLDRVISWLWFAVRNHSKPQPEMSYLQAAIISLTQSDIFWVFFFSFTFPILNSSLNKMRNALSIPIFSLVLSRNIPL